MIQYYGCQNLTGLSIEAQRAKMFYTCYFWVDDHLLPIIHATVNAVVFVLRSFLGL